MGEKSALSGHGSGLRNTNVCCLRSCEVVICNVGAGECSDRPHSCVNVVRGGAETRSHQIPPARAVPW
jgi:hypothetical protein